MAIMICIIVINIVPFLTINYQICHVPTQTALWPRPLNANNIGQTHSIKQRNPKLGQLYRLNRKLTPTISLNSDRYLWKEFSHSTLTLIYVRSHIYSFSFCFVLILIFGSAHTHTHTCMFIQSPRQISSFKICSSFLICISFIIISIIIIIMIILIKF